MNIQEIIAKKRDKNKLSKEEINYFIENYTNNNITDYQAAALIMCIYLNGMDEEETINLTMAMVNSGNVLDLSDLGIVVDKHSTGGVGDKVTLILAPVVASLGVPIAKMSGRGLGYTGGTMDKLESIPGYKTNLSIKEFKENVKKIGISLIGQNMDLVPADKKIYQLRDSISATESIPLIASSIMSKKIASGGDKIVINVTYGNGAFMKSIEEARKLASVITRIGNMMKKETACVISSMEQPLGRNVGNILEVQEAIEALKGNMQDDVKEIVLELGSHMIQLAGRGDDIEENKNKMMENINNGKAFEKFRKLVQNQGGDISYIDHIERFEKAKYIIPVKSRKEGIIKKLPAEEVGKVSLSLGAGRKKKEDEIDKKVGIVFEKKIGDKVKIGEILAYIHSDDEEKGKKATSELEHIYNIVAE